MGTMASRSSHSYTADAGKSRENLPLPAQPPPKYGATSTMNQTSYKCRKCNRRFDSANAASAHEETEHAHTCGICKVLRFQTIQELSNHKRTCGDIVIIDSGDDNDSSSAEGTAIRDDEATKSQTVGPSAGKTNGGNSVPTANSITGDKGTGSENKTEWLTIWTCDICKTAQFESYDAAVEHEAICLKGSSGVQAQETLTKPQDQVVELPSVQSAHSKRKNIDSSINTKAEVLFSPILSDSSDSLHYHEISMYHRRVLESLQLLQIPSHYASGERVGTGFFHCQFCSQKICPPNLDGNGIARDWSMDSIVNELPATVVTHLRTVCTPTQKLHGTKSLITADYSQPLENKSFEKFLRSFFAENGITVLPDVGGIVVLHDDDFMNNPQANKSKRGRQLLYGSMKPRAEKRSKQPIHDSKQQISSTSEPKKLDAAEVEDTGKKPSALPTKKGVRHPRSKNSEIKYGNMGCKMHNEYGSFFLVAPLDGLPFINSFSKEEKKKLHPSEIILLQQLELFTMTSELMKSASIDAPPQSVGIRCRNCIADKDGCCFIKISSVGSMSQNLLLLVKEHVKKCTFLRPKDLKLLELHNGYQGRLANYCDWLAKLYSIEDSNDGAFRTGAVVWGESPKLPEVYCLPSDIDISFCVQGS